MKKTLILFSLFTVITAALSTLTETGVGAANEVDTDISASQILSTDSAAKDPTVDSPVQLSVFGQSAGVYQFDWVFELTESNGDLLIKDEGAEGTDGIRKRRADRSLLLSLTLPAQNEDGKIQIKIGLDVRQLTAEASEPPATQTTLPLTTAAPTTQAPVTATTVTEIPTSQPLTTAASVTASTTAQVPATTTPESPTVTAGPTAAVSTTQAPVTEAPVTEAPVTTEKPAGSGAIPETVPAMEYTEEDLLWLARIIQAEAGGVSMESKIAVGTVVLNRVESPKFPNTIYDVIFQKNQFSPVKSGSIYKTPSEDSYEAARRCLEGERTDRRILYFMMTKYAPGSWMDNNRELIVIIDSESFYA